MPTRHRNKANGMHEDQLRYWDLYSPCATKNYAALCFLLQNHVYALMEQRHIANL